MYKIQCNNCDKLYIGQTKRKLNTRLKEHVNHFKNKNPEKSAMAKHAIDTGHTFSSINLIQEVRNPNYLDAHESLIMKKHEKYLVNNEPGPLQNSNLLQFLNQ